VHAVGPVWRGGDRGEDEQLASCYRESLRLASNPQLGISSIAFPSISTGAYGFPIQRAAGIAVTEVDRFLAGSASLQCVIFCAYSPAAYKTYLKVASAILG
jgi:O-acetyl-ADP-ribose deacetylase (regulator of RNase III)